MSSPMFDIPEHLSMPVNEWGDGPLDDDEQAYALVCWCRLGALCSVIPAQILGTDAVGSAEKPEDSNGTSEPL